MAKDRTVPCIYYVCAHAECQKGFRDVTTKRCKTCEKYRPRKTAYRPEPISRRRQKDRDRHDDWRNNY